MQNTYGFKFDDLDSFAQQLGEILQIEWEARENSFSGNYFVSGDHPDEMLRLENNYFEPEGWSMEEFQDYGLLLYVNNTMLQRQKELERCFQEKLDVEWKLIYVRDM